jgi:hypothetical protein
MYAMIRRYRVGAGSIEEVMRTVDVRVADRAQAELGIIGYQAIALDSETIMTITLFASEEQLHRSAAMAEQIRQGLAEFQVESIEAASGQVMVARGSPQLAEPIHAKP